MDPEHRFYFRFVLGYIAKDLFPRTVVHRYRIKICSRRKMEPPSGQMGQLEKAITVYGQPENCSAACRRILEVMAEEAKSVGKDQEISLKILAHNNLIGRIIGKQGATIKKIMEVG